MSLALAETNRLAAPLRVATMPPSSLIAEQLAFIPELHEEPSAPEFLLAARVFAERNEGSPAAAVRLAQAEQAAGDDEAAVRAATKALKLIRREPDSSLAFALVQLLIGCNRIDLAARAIEDVPSSDVRAVLAARIAIEHGELEQALALLEPVETLEALSARGWVLLELRRYAEAVRAFRRALSIGRANPTLLTNLGYAHAALGARERAIKETKQAHVLTPASELIGFNLVSYYLADGRSAEALSELARLREFHPTRLRFDLAEADIHLRHDDVARAYAILRRARTSQLWAMAEPAELAELTANLAFVEWRLGELGRKEARAIVVDELARTGFAHLPITGLLPPLLRMREDAEELEWVVGKVEAANPNEELHQLRTHLALLRCDFAEAVERAVAWAEDQIFNAHAAAAAVHLLTDVSGEYDRAIDIGLKALRVAGSPGSLVNNVAYALALAGRVDEARDLLPDDTGESVHLTATKALVDILSGSGHKFRHDR
jgi:tetratricopeptide (TPR) repeat protein